MGQLRRSSVLRQQGRTIYQRGVAMVEFLVSVPLLLLMFVAVVEFGIMFYTQTTLNKSVQDGVRYLAAHSIYGQFNFVEVRAQQRIEVSNLVVYGNIWGNGQPLIEGFDTTMVTVECKSGSLDGIQCYPDAALSSIYPLLVKAEIQYTPALGGMLTSLTGINTSIPLNASAINVGF